MSDASLEPRMRWWGWGDDSGHVELPAAALAMLRSELGLRDRAHAARGARGGAAAGAALSGPALGASPRGGGGSVRGDRLSRVSHAAGRSYPDLARLRAGEAGARAGRGGATRVRRRAGRAARSLRRGARCGDPVRRRHERGGRSRAAARRDGSRRLARPGAHGRAHRHRPRAPSPPRSSRAASARAWRPRCEPRPHARPLPAELRVRDRGRLGGDALGRPGVHGLRPHRRAGARACAASRRGRAGREDGARVGGRPVLARARGGLGGCARRGHGVHACGAARCPRRAATRASRSAPSTRAWSASARWSRRDSSPDVARLSDEEETRLTMALASTGSPPSGSGAPTCALRGHEGGCVVIVGLGGRGRRGRGPPARRERGAPASAAAPWRWASGPGGRGCAAATPRPTCATSCSAAACSWRRSRPPPPGRSLRELYDAVGDALRESLAARRHAAARDVPRVPPVPHGRVALLHVHRAAHGRRAGRLDRAVARGEVGRLRRDRRARRHAHAPPRDRHRPRALDARRDRRPRAWSAEGSKGAPSTPRAS